MRDQGLNLFYPLSEFYERAGLALPPATRVKAHDVPEPYRRLLAHENGMTVTLEDAYGHGIHLRVLDSSLHGNVCSRKVVLLLDGDDTAVALGAARIDLDHLPLAARELVIEGKQPLGAILYTQGIAHASRPEYYFQVMADAVIAKVLQLSGPCRLYGRRSALVNPSKQILAEVMEILAPASGISGLEIVSAKS